MHGSNAPSETPPSSHGFDKLGAVRALQRYPKFRFLWTSNFFFFTGNWMQTLVMGYIAYELTRSTFLLAIFTAARMMPMLLGPLGGVIAERVDKPRLLLYAQVLIFAVMIVVSALASLERLEYWHLVAAGLLMGLAQAPVQPARATLVMDIVERKDVANAIALNTIAFDITRIIGPAVGGGLVAWLGSTTALWVSSSWYIVAGLALLPILNVNRGLPRRSGSPMKDLIEGFRVMLGNRDMALLLSITVSANGLVYAGNQSFMPVFAKEVLGVGAAGLGILGMWFGIGATVGAVVIASMGDIPYKGKLYILGTVVLGLFYALFGLSTSYPLSQALLFITGLGAAAFGIMQTTLLLIVAPPELRGRAMGLQMLAIGILPIATLVQGAVASQIGVQATAAICGFLLVINMIALWFRAPRVRDLR